LRIDYKDLFAPLFHRGTNPLRVKYGIKDLFVLKFSKEIDRFIELLWPEAIYIFRDFQKIFDFLPLISFGRKIRDGNKITGQYVRRIGVSMTLQNDG
jgi:hypothetical protein